MSRMRVFAWGYAARAGKRMYLLFVMTCGEKWAIAERAGREREHDGLWFNNESFLVKRKPGR